jgi:hypothetical protein
MKSYFKVAMKCNKSMINKHKQSRKLMLTIKP